MFNWLKLSGIIESIKQENIMHIIGAGLAGCIAATLNPSAKVLEASEQRPDNHKAVLRFRTKAVSDLTGIEFEEIKVRKSIFFKGKHYSECNPAFGNMYSEKVVGKLSDRSIWNLDSVTRYIAPENFHSLLLDRLEETGKIQYNQKINLITEKEIHTQHGSTIRDGAIISTMPMPVMMKCVGILPDEQPEFNSREIQTIRAKVPNSNVHQTIYYPRMDSLVYRATLTGDDMIIECVQGTTESDVANIVMYVCDSFGVNFHTLPLTYGLHTQKFGKISSINDSTRKNYIVDLTDELNIYSLGRFAIWKNILLDDVVDDLYIIQKLNQADSYQKRLIRK